MSKLIRKSAALLAAIVTFFTGCKFVDDMAMLYMAPVADLTVTGKVTDSATEQELAEIRLSLLSGNVTNTSGSTIADGSFYLSAYDVEPGTFNLIADDLSGAHASRSFSITFDTEPFLTNINVDMDPSD